MQWSVNFIRNCCILIFLRGVHGVKVVICDVAHAGVYDSAWKSCIQRFVITEKAPTSVLNVKAVVAAFNQEKALVGAWLYNFTD